MRARARDGSAQLRAVVALGGMFIRRWSLAVAGRSQRRLHDRLPARGQRGHVRRHARRYSLSYHRGCSTRRAQGQPGRNLSPRSAPAPSRPSSWTIRAYRKAPRRCPDRCGSTPPWSANAASGLGARQEVVRPRRAQPGSDLGWRTRTAAPGCGPRGEVRRPGVVTTGVRTRLPEQTPRRDPSTRRWRSSPSAATQHGCRRHRAALGP